MEKSVSKTIGINLVKLRKHKNLKQVDLAKKFNFSDKTISKWESGESLPSIDVLCSLCDFYGITLNDLTNENFICEQSDSKTIAEDKTGITNKIIITLLAITLVWIVATIAFIYAKIIANENVWIVFIWAIPISLIIGIIFNGIWGSRNLKFILTSLLVWALLASAYLQMIEYNIWIIFILGIPSQIAIILWSGLKSNKKQNKNTQN